MVSHGAHIIEVHIVAIVVFVSNIVRVEVISLPLWRWGLIIPVTFPPPLLVLSVISNNVSIVRNLCVAISIFDNDVAVGSVPV